MNQKTIKKYSSLRYKKYRKKYGLFLAEGHHIIDDLLKSDFKIHIMITSDKEKSERYGVLNKIPSVDLVKASVLNKIADARTPQDTLAVVEIPPLPDAASDIKGNIVIADRIKDPGNLGTLIRTARAFGFTAVISTSTSADVFNPKTVRATQGAIFGIRLIYSVNIDYLTNLLRPAYTFYALDPRGDVDIDDIQPADRSALIVGSEIEGIEKHLLDMADYKIRIPQSGLTDSLNAAVAGGIALYRFRRI